MLFETTSYMLRLFLSYDSAPETRLFGDFRGRMRLAKGGEGVPTRQRRVGRKPANEEPYPHRRKPPTILRRVRHWAGVAGSGHGKKRQFGE